MPNLNEYPLDDPIPSPWSGNIDSQARMLEGHAERGHPLKARLLDAAKQLRSARTVGELLAAQKTMIDVALDSAFVTGVR